MTGASTEVALRDSYETDFWEPQDSPLFPVSRRGKVRPCPHCQRRGRMVLLAILAVLVMIAGAVAAFLVKPPPLRAVVSSGPVGVTLASYTYPGDRILDKAETRLNDSYSWGAAGPSYFDCSGLVYWAANAAGERGWPRDTAGIAAQTGSRFSITSHPQRGDLAMWGPASAPFHVELVTIWSHTTFGTETYGWAGRVTWHDDTWFRPWFYLHVNW